jgi:hypothetical protein
LSHAEEQHNDKKDWAAGERQTKRAHAERKRKRRIIVDGLFSLDV